MTAKRKYFFLFLLILIIFITSIALIGHRRIKSYPAPLTIIGKTDSFMRSRGYHLDFRRQDAILRHEAPVDLKVIAFFLKKNNERYLRAKPSIYSWMSHYSKGNRKSYIVIDVVNSKVFHVALYAADAESGLEQEFYNAMFEVKGIGIKALLL